METPVGSGLKYVPCILKYVRHILNYVGHNFYLLPCRVYELKISFHFSRPEMSVYVFSRLREPVNNANGPQGKNAFSACWR